MNTTPLGFLLISLALYLAGALASLLLSKREQLAIQASGIAGVLGGGCGASGGRAGSAGRGCAALLGGRSVSLRPLCSEA